MKKLLCVVIMSLILSAPVHAFAVDFSSLDLFSSMSVYDLLRARNLLSEELMKRGYHEYTLNVGEHTVGEAISPGVYTLSAPDLTLSTILVYSAEGDLISMRSVNYNWKYHESSESKGRNQIELTEGQVLKVMAGPMTFYEY